MKKCCIIILGAQNTSTFRSIPSLQLISENKTLLDYQLNSFDAFDKQVQFIGGDDFDMIRMTRGDIITIIINPMLLTVTSLLHADLDTAQMHLLFMVMFCLIKF